MKPSLRVALALAGLALAPAAWTPGAFAENKQLISGPGSTLTNAKCTLCHDNDHISRTRLTRPEWEENLRNMISRGFQFTTILSDNALLNNADFVVTEPKPDKPFAYQPFAMRTKYDFIEGYAGNDTVRGDAWSWNGREWREEEGERMSCHRRRRHTRGEGKERRRGEAPRRVPR